MDPGGATIIPEGTAVWVALWWQMPASDWLLTTHHALHSGQRVYKPELRVEEADLILVNLRARNQQPEEEAGSPENEVRSESREPNT